MKCPNCNTTNHKDGSRFCHICGTELPKSQTKIRYNGLIFTEKLKDREQTQNIIIHHSCVIRPHTIKDVHQWHQKDRGWAGVGYHFFISKKGLVSIGRPVEKIGSHFKANGYNLNSIGVCFEGDFSRETMKDEQISGDVIRLLFFLQRFYESDLLFCDELDGYVGSPLKGFNKTLLLNKISTFWDWYDRETESLFGKESAQPFYEWIDEVCYDFGLPFKILDTSDYIE